jgi:hypothetical protein
MHEPISSQITTMTGQDIFGINPKDKIECIQIDRSYIFFDGAVSFLAGLCSTNLLIDSYLSKAEPYKEGHYLFFEGQKNATNKIYYFFPYDIYKYLIDNKWPDKITIHYKNKSFDDQEEIEGEINGFVKVFLYLGQATYIQYWENTKERIVKQFGNDQTKWGNIFQFGWIVRNALAHNFKVTVNNNKIDNITWNGLKFGYTTNGIDISEHIMFLELLILMKDIEDELKKYSS